MRSRALTLTCRTPEEGHESGMFTSIPTANLLDPGVADLAVLFGAGFLEDVMLESKVAVLRTGDVGVMDKQGAAFVGRSGMVAKISGTIFSFSPL